MFYCQHVLGIGHLMRSLSLVKALKDKCEIYFLNGGTRITGIPFPPKITMIDLPALQMDEEFQTIQSGDREQPIETIQRKRRELLLAEWERIQPDIVIFELFPFGRKRFALELVPLLARNRLAGSPSKIVCSLRDILVSKSDPARHEAWVCSLINRYFDLVLVHSDPTFQTLDETFGRANDLQCDIRHTGFIAQPPDAAGTNADIDTRLGQDDSPLIVVSIGGGRVGYELLDCAIKAGILLQATLPHRMLVLSGPNLPEPQFHRLQELVEGRSGLVLQRYTAQFLQYLQKADLSLSMAGYNTCMNIVTSGVRSLVLPFTGHGNDEQSIRAQKLEQRGILGIIEPYELDPDILREKISHILSGTGEQTRARLNTDGAAKTARLVNKFLEKPDTSLSANRFASPAPSAPLWEDTLRESLKCLHSIQQTIRIFFRDDDSDEDEETLRHLLDISLSRQVPLTLAVIPGKLTDATIQLFKRHKRAAPTLLEIHQHGWTHVNHEQEGRKCEFGPSRTYQEQYDDIARGKAIMEQAFPLRFFPAFTPPWNRCTQETFKVLDELGFQVLSKD